MTTRRDISGDDLAEHVVTEFAAATRARANAELWWRRLLVEADDLAIPRVTLAEAAGLTGAAITRATARARSRQVA